MSSQIDFKFSDCRKCVFARINRDTGEQKETPTCRECDSGEFFEERRADTVSLMSSRS